ncbi:MAG: DnaJ domain-containing protein [Deltaproteobacteria bacterium]
MSSSVASARAPFYHPVAGVDVRALPLLPEQAYVLSRVDGRSDEAAISRATGIPTAEVFLHLQRLEELGAVQRPTTVAPPKALASAKVVAADAIHGRATPKAPGPVPASARPTRSASPPPSPNPDTDQRPTKPAPSGPLHPDVDESLGLSVEVQTRILDLSARLGEIDHFELLGVARNADRTTIKRAYFSIIGTFHPDTYFGKQLGGFTRRMEKVFQRLTEAHDVLSNPRTREEYEGYLGAVGRTRGFESPSEPPPSVEDMERLLEQAEQQRKSPAPAPPSLPPQQPSLRPRQPSLRPQQPSLRPQQPALPPQLPPRLPSRMPPPPLPGARTPSRRPVQLVNDPAARRQALARKFGLVPVPTLAPGPPDEEKLRADAARQSAAAKDLHQRYEHRKTAIRDHRVQRFIQVAEEAVAAGNAVSAMNSLKIARTLTGGDVAAEARIEQLEKGLGATVSESYLTRARYEESNGHHAEAARSYTRAARGSPDADVLRSAAECYLTAGTELRLASELAREAVQMAPDRTDLRLSLAKIYEAAGMPQSAVRELERALSLTPGSDRIKQWLKRLERGGV